MNFFSRSGTVIHPGGPGGVLRVGPFGPDAFGPRGPLGVLAVLVVLAIVIGVAALIVTFLVRRTHLASRLSGRVGSAGRGSDALRILDERFARGEIDAADYRERRDLLQGTA